MLLGLRESPLSAIALENALKLSRLGVTIMPLSPAFYLQPKSVDQMVSDFVDHIFSALHLPSKQGWREELI
jgi:4-hydroxy-3-polyprenylbenzoate decarboxylase